MRFLRLSPLALLAAVLGASAQSSIAQAPPPASAPNLECSTDHTAMKDFEDFVRAYERNDLLGLRERLDPALVGLQRFLDGVQQDFNLQKQLRLHVKDLQLQCGPDVTVLQMTWEKRYLSLPAFTPQLVTGRMSVLLHRQRERWRLAAVGGDSPFGTAVAGSAAEIEVSPTVDISPLTALGPGHAVAGVNLPVMLTVVDADQAGRGSLQVVVTTDQGDRETLTLTETVGGRFTRSAVPFAAASPVPGDGVLQVATNAVLTVRYADLQPGNGRPAGVVSQTIRAIGAPFVPDAVPDPFAFAPVANAALGAMVTSQAVTVGGINTATPIGIVGGSYSVNGGPFTSAPGTVTAGASVRVQVLSSSSPATAQTATLTVGGVSAAFTVATLAADTTPDPFSFLPQTNVPLGSVVTANPIAVTGINAAAPIAVSGGRYAVNGGAFTTAPGLVPPGATVQLQLTASSLPSTPTSAVLSIGGVSASFTATTQAVILTPNPFSFAPVTNVAPSTIVTSAPALITGTTGPAPISITGGSYSINGGAFSSAPATITAGQSVQVRLTSSGIADGSGSASAVLHVGTANGTFTVTTWDAKPNPFSWPSMSSCSATPTTSVPVVISGLTTSVPITITSGAGLPAANAMYSIDGAPFTAGPGVISNGQSLRVQATGWAPSTAGPIPPTVRAIVNIGGVSGTWSLGC